MPRPRRSSMRSRSSATVASNAARVPTGDRVGDRPVQPVRIGVELLVGPVAHRDRQRRASPDRRRAASACASARSRPARRAAATRRDGPARPGGCRRSRPGCPVSRVHSAAASWERAELRGAHEQHRLGAARRPRGRRPSSGVAARGGRSGGGRRRWSGCARSARPARARRGGGPAGSTGPREPLQLLRRAVRAAPARRRSPGGTDHRARRDDRHVAGTHLRGPPAQHSTQRQLSQCHLHGRRSLTGGVEHRVFTGQDGGVMHRARLRRLVRTAPTSIDSTASSGHTSVLQRTDSHHVARRRSSQSS